MTTTRGSKQPATPLGELIEDMRLLFLDQHGVELSYGAIARRAGDSLTRQRVQQLAKLPLKELPSPLVVRGLAVGLGIPESVVLEKALESAGYEVPRVLRRSEAADATAMKATTARDREERRNQDMLRRAAVGRRSTDRVDESRP